MLRYRLFVTGLAALSFAACNVTPPSDQVMQVVALEYADPEGVAATLTALLAQASGDAPATKVRAHAENGSVIIVGSAERVQQSLELIARLDVPAAPTGETPTASAAVPAASDGLLVIYLENTLAADMQGALDEFLKEAEEPREVRVRADEATNTLLLSGGSSKRNEQLLALIKRLDRKI